MGIFDRRNTFYNSTWHQYKLPSSSWQLTNPLVTQDGNNIKLNWNGYNHPQNSIVWNPFGLEQRSWTGYNPETGEYGTLPMSPRYVEPSQYSYIDPIPPYKPYNAPSHYDYEDIYADGDDDRKPVSSDTVDKVKAGLGAASQVVDALGQGRTTGAGEKDANYYINAVSKLGSNLPGVAGLVFSSINAASSLQNALAGSQLDEKNIKAFESAIQNRARWQMGDNSTTSALVGSSANNVDLKVPGVKYFGKDPLLSDILGYGVGKASGKAWSMKQPTAQANAQAHNTEALGYKDYQNKMIRRGLLAEPYALGGAINRFDNGGGINKPYTHGSLFTNGLVQINNGGSHEANPYQGVQFGVDPQGIPNMVEEGETIFNAGAYGGPDSYSFSDRIKFPTKEYGNMFALGGKTKRVKGKRNKNYTFADISKLLSKESEERPNDDKSLRTLAANLEKLAMVQEEVKAKDMLSQMNPLDIMAALQQSPIGEQMVGDAQQNMNEQPVMQQQPMMAACGGKLYGLGGNLFAIGGGVNDSILPYELDYLQQLKDFSLQDYIDYLNDSRIYKGKKTGRSSNTSSRRKTTTTTKPSSVTNHSYINGKVVTDLPQSMALNEPLFEKAVTEYIDDKKQQYDKAVKEGRFDDAYNIAQRVQSDIRNINTVYFGTYNYDRTKYTRPGSVDLLQKWFDELGFNKYVNEALNTPNAKGEYLVYKGTKDQQNPYTSDNSLDSQNGSVTQARFFPISESNKRKLESMDMKVGRYEDLAKDVYARYGEDIAAKEYRQVQPYTIQELKGIPLALMKDMSMTNVIKNPKYKEGSDKPEEKNQYIPIDEDILQYVPKDYAGTAQEWWNSLNDQQKNYTISQYYKSQGNKFRSGVYEYTQLYEPNDRPYRDQAQNNKNRSEFETQTTKRNGLQDRNYYIPEPRNNWESAAALGVALGDYLESMFGKTSNFQNPGLDTAYDYLSRVGNIPVVRSTPTGTKMTYKPTDLNFGLNADRSDMFGLIRTSNNLNKGNATANDIAIMNAGREQMAKTRQQAVEEDLKKLQFVLQNNNQVDQTNAQNSLTAQQANTQAAARAREVQAQIAATLAGTLGQSYNNYLNYKNQQSSGLAQMLYDMGYNKQVMDQRDSSVLLYNQHPEVLRALGVNFRAIPYDYMAYISQNDNPYQKELDEWINGKKTNKK